MPINQKGIVPLYLILLALVGIGIGIYLVQHPAVFKPKADTANAKILSASPNPCVLTSTGLCTSTISWDTRNNISSTQAKPLKITIKENPGSLFAYSTQGSQNAPWISAAGATFDAYVDGVLVDSLYVKGAAANTSVTPSPSPNTLRNGLISYWNFNETAGNVAADLMNLANATVTGTSVVDGKISKARLFSRPGDIVDAGKTLSINASNMTVSAWLYTPLTAGAIQTFISHAGYGVELSFVPSSWSADIQPNNKLRLSIGKGASSSGQGWVNCYSNTKLLPNTWYLFTGTNDGTNMKIYINGVLDSTCTGINNLLATSGAKTIIGHDQNISNTNTPFLQRDYYGIIDEVGVWNRALSASEILDLANGATPGGASANTPPTSITPASTPTPTPTPTPAPAQPTENPAYQYHYDPNNQGN